MNEATQIRMAQLRQAIMEKANQISRQVTLAFEDMGRVAAEGRVRAGSEEMAEPAAAPVRRGGLLSRPDCL